MSVIQRTHPALARFCSWTDQTSRMLLVSAAPGTGRTWFAQSWIGSRRGEIYDYSSNPFQVLEECASLSKRLSEDQELHIAVVLAPNINVWDLDLVLNVLIAEQRDLLLRPDEIVGLLENPWPSRRDIARDIYRQCGGWLNAVNKLVEDTQFHEPAVQLIRSSMVIWLGHRDPTGELAESVFLPTFDEKALDSFYGYYSSNPHTLDDLVRCGLIQQDDRGHWVMPSMIRRLLSERARRLGPERTVILQEAARVASIDSNGILSAAKLAIGHRNWGDLSRIVIDHWDEIILDDPKHLRELIRKIPPFVGAQHEYLHFGTRILETVTRHELCIPAPLLKPEYPNDHLAQKLRSEAGRLYSKPSGRSITLGFLEMLHLRLNGMYEEAADAALRARAALHKVQALQSVRPSFAALIHAQAGTCLYLAGREYEALQSYELSIADARLTENSYLQADVAGRLALLHAVAGNVSLARRYLDEHGQSIGNVCWGRTSAERAGIIARGYLAASNLDWELGADELAKLPQTIDRDELWPAHLYLIAVHKIRSGIPNASKRLVHQVHQVRRQRPLASAAPLARKLLDDILVMVAMIERAQLPKEIDRDQTDPTLLALKELRDENPDAALVLLNDRKDYVGIRTSGNLGEYLEIVARSMAGPTGAATNAIQRLHEESGTLYEIGLLKLLPGWEKIDSLLALGEGAQQKLARVSNLASREKLARPTLTPREHEVLRALREGKTRKQIAEEGFRSEETIKSQIKSLYRKLDAKNSEQLLVRARFLGV